MEGVSISPVLKVLTNSWRRKMQKHMIRTVSKQREVENLGIHKREGDVSYWEILK